MIQAPYDSGKICGRFQHIHKGHERLIDTSLILCRRVLILVGSAQEVATERNPFDVATRIEMIREVYPDTDRVIIKPLNDLTNEHDISTDWGVYLMDNAKRYLMKQPEIMIYGNDDSRSKWFDNNTLKNTSEHIINRNAQPLSATEIREWLLFDEQEKWQENTNQHLHKHYPRLQAELRSVPYYNELYKDALRNGRPARQGWQDKAI